MQIQREKEHQSFQITEEYDIDKGMDGADFRERMLMNNSIDGLLKFEINIVNNEKTYEYNILEMESLDTVCKKEKLKMAGLTTLLNDILQSVFCGREFMLAENDYILDPNLIFINKNGKTHVAYYSGYAKPIRGQLQALAEFLMNNIDYTDEMAVLMAYTLYMKTKEENCSLEDIVAYIRSKTAVKTGPAIRKISGPEFLEAAEKAEHRSSSDDMAEIRTKARDKEEYLADTESISELNGKKLRKDKRKSENHAADNNHISDKQDASIYKNEETAAGKMKILLHASTAVQKLEAVLAILIPALALYALISSSFMLDKSGKTDTVKLTAAILLFGGLVLFLQQKIWRPVTSKINIQGAKSQKEKSPQPEEDGAATVLLFDKNVKTHFVCSFVSDDYPAIRMEHFPFCIGKDPENTDYCLDVDGVSRRHLLVDRVGIEFTVTDLNSTNGSFLNDKRLAPNTAYHLSKMDKITIGQCVFYMN